MRRCVYCQTVYPRHLEPYLTCGSGQPMIDFQGDMFSLHEKDQRFDVNEWVAGLQVSGVWATVTHLQCQVCEVVFPLVDYAQCLRHDTEIVFPPGDAPKGKYPCCDAAEYRFNPFFIPRGCKRANHSVDITSETFRVFLAHRHLIFIDEGREAAGGDGEKPEEGKIAVEDAASTGGSRPASASVDARSGVGVGGAKEGDGLVKIFGRWSEGIYRRMESSNPAINMMSGPVGVGPTVATGKGSRKKAPAYIQRADGSTAPSSTAFPAAIKPLGWSNTDHSLVLQQFFVATGRPAMSVAARAEEHFDVALSFQNSDENVASRVRENLQTRGLKVKMGWKSEGNIDCQVVVPMLSEKYESSQECKKDLQRALEGRKNCLPVRLDKSSLPWSSLMTAGTVPVDLSDSAAAKGTAEWEKKMRRIYRLIKTTIENPSNSDPILSPPAPAAAAASFESSSFMTSLGVDADAERMARKLWRAANSGDDIAQCSLGYLYERGIGVEMNFAQAFKFYKMAADQGNAKAMNSVARCFEQGIGIERDPSQAFSMFETAAKNGNVKALTNLGYCYKYGVGTDKDEKRAFDAYLTAAESGEDSARFNVANSYLTGAGVEKDTTMAFTLMQQAADKGSLNALNHVADCYQTGAGVEKDEVKAFQYYSNAAKQGNHTAFQKVADCLENGLGVEKDVRAAAQMYFKSAELGNAKAMVNLGAMYESGVGVPANPELAFALYKRSSENGDKKGSVGLASCYLKGTGVQRSYKNAIGVFVKMADEGSIKAAMAVMDLHEKGVPVAHDAETSDALYNKYAAMTAPSAASPVEKKKLIQVDIAQSDENLNAAYSNGDIGESMFEAVESAVTEVPLDNMDMFAPEGENEYNDDAFVETEQPAEEGVGEEIEGESATEDRQIVSSSVEDFQGEGEQPTVQDDGPVSAVSQDPLLVDDELAVDAGQAENVSAEDYLADDSHDNSPVDAEAYLADDTAFDSPTAEAPHVESAVSAAPLGTVKGGEPVPLPFDESAIDAYLADPSAADAASRAAEMPRDSTTSVGRASKAASVKQEEIRATVQRDSAVQRPVSGGQQDGSPRHSQVKPGAAQQQGSSRPSETRASVVMQQGSSRPSAAQKSVAQQEGSSHPSEAQADATSQSNAHATEPTAEGNGSIRQSRVSKAHSPENAIKDVGGNGSKTVSRMSKANSKQNLVVDNANGPDSKKETRISKANSEQSLVNGGVEGSGSKRESRMSKANSKQSLVNGGAEGSGSKRELRKSNANSKQNLVNGGVEGSESTKESPMVKAPSKQSVVNDGAEGSGSKRELRTSNANSKQNLVNGGAEGSESTRESRMIKAPSKQSVVNGGAESSGSTKESRMMKASSKQSVVNNDSEAHTDAAAHTGPAHGGPAETSPPAENTHAEGDATPRLSEVDSQHVQDSTEWNDSVWTEPALDKLNNK
ncbi:hypothetical protein HK101_001739 [Irineochytrium annulatum]|nr:hypothetical protein HK101_001739 [Irineochytrium annulatum]